MTMKGSFGVQQFVFLESHCHCTDSTRQFQPPLFSFISKILFSFLLLLFIKLLTWTERGTLMLQIDLLNISQSINLIEYQASIHKCIKELQGHDVCEPVSPEQCVCLSVAYIGGFGVLCIKMSDESHPRRLCSHCIYASAVLLEIKHSLLLLFQVSFTFWLLDTWQLCNVWSANTAREGLNPSQLFSLRRDKNSNIVLPSCFAKHFCFSVPKCKPRLKLLIHTFFMCLKISSHFIQDFCAFDGSGTLLLSL